jgi:hypothetical protein
VHVERGNFGLTERCVLLFEDHIKKGSEKRNSRISLLG